MMSALCVTDMAQSGAGEPPTFSYEARADPLRQKLHEARQQSNFTDFMIKVDDKQIPCHKLILSLQSEYFNRMLSHEGTKEVLEGTVTLVEELDPSAVLLVVEFFYSGKINVPFELAKQVIKVANYFQANDDELMKKLCVFIADNLTPENCLQWFILASKFNLDTLMKKARLAMVRDFEAVSEGLEFLNLEAEQFSYLFNLAKQLTTQDKVLEAAVKWTMHDVATRKDVFEGIIKNIDIKLGECSSDVLLGVYEKHREVLITDSEVQQQFTIAAFTLAKEQASDILVMGGVDIHGRRHSTEEAWVLNLKTGVHGKKSSPPRFAGAFCDSPVGVICVGGSAPLNDDNSHVTPSAACDLYDKKTHSWVPVPPLPAPVACAGAVCVWDTRLMVVCGGKPEVNEKKSLWL